MGARPRECPTDPLEINVPSPARVAALGAPRCSRRGDRCDTPIPRHSVPTPGCCGSQSHHGLCQPGACASRGHTPASRPPSPPGFCSRRISGSPRQSGSPGGGQRGWVYCGSSAYSRCPRAAGKAGHASSRCPPWSQGRAVPERVRPRTVPQGGWALAWGLPGRAAVVPVLPVPRGERQRDGDTQGPLSHRDRILHLLGSDVRPVRSWCHWLHRCTIPKNPFPGVLTPPHPRSAASQAPRAEPSSSGGAGARHRVHPEVRAVGSGQGAGPGASCQGYGG